MSTISFHKCTIDVEIEAKFLSGISSIVYRVDALRFSGLVLLTYFTTFHLPDWLMLCLRWPIADQWIRRECKLLSYLSPKYECVSLQSRLSLLELWAHSWIMLLYYFIKQGKSGQLWTAFNN